ncbi:hypothetical protein ABKV19_013780 [Rosa sericea]
MFTESSTQTPNNLLYSVATNPSKKMATFELYRRSTIRMCLTETLDEMVQNGTLRPELAIQSMTEALETQVKSKVSIKELRNYRRALTDAEEAIRLSNTNVKIRRCCDVLRIRWEWTRSHTKERALMMMETLSKCGQSKGDDSSLHASLNFGSHGNGGINSIYPSDLVPFTRKPLFLVIDCDSSEAFDALLQVHAAVAETDQPK